MLVSLAMSSLAFAPSELLARDAHGAFRALGKGLPDSTNHSQLPLPQRVIWSYWKDGQPPPAVLECIRTWETPSWTVRILDQVTVSQWLDEGIDFPRETWRRRPAHQSDMFGLALLARHGGVWLDASVLLSAPLDWMLERLRWRDFVGYQNWGGVPETLAFASRAGGAVVTEWRRELHEAWQRCGEDLNGVCLATFFPCDMAERNQLPCPEPTPHDVYLHPGQIAMWLRTRGSPQVQRALQGLDFSARGPYRLIGSLLQRETVNGRADVVPALLRARGPLPAAIQQQRLHKLLAAGEMPRTQTNAAAGSWWEQLVRRAPTADSVIESEQPVAIVGRRCLVVAAAECGVAERVATIATAAEYASQHGCNLHVQWEKDHAQAPFGFAELFEVPSAGSSFLTVNAREMPPLTHGALGWEAGVEPHDAPAIVFRQPQPAAVRGGLTSLEGSSIYARLQPRPQIMAALRHSPARSMSDAERQRVAVHTSFEFCPPEGAMPAVEETPAVEEKPAERRTYRCVSRACEEHVAQRSNHRALAFDAVYSQRAWGDWSETGGSGPGSSPQTTTTVSGLLVTLITVYGVQSILDAPCGNMSWMPQVMSLATKLRRIDGLVPGVAASAEPLIYTGVDVAPTLVAELQERHRAQASWRFIAADVSEASMTPHDLIISKDFFFHLRDGTILGALRSFVRSNSTFLLATHNPHATSNSENLVWRAPVAQGGATDGGLDGGGYRPVNLHLPPYGLPPPIFEVEDDDLPAASELRRVHSLWRLQDLRLALFM